MSETKYQMHRMTDVVRYFVKGFELPDGKTIADYEWFYDAKKDMVVLCLQVETAEKEPVSA